jgi:hypothetical protein
LRLPVAKARRIGDVRAERGYAHCRVFCTFAKHPEQCETWDGKQKREGEFLFFG